MSRRVLVVDGVRTPFVKAGADLSSVAAWQLGSAAAREVTVRAGLSPEQIDEVIFGCVAHPSDSANIARVVALRSGVPESTPALTVSRNCASGLEAVTLAAEKIAAGTADIVLCGGLESMSQIPLHYPQSFSRKLSGVMRARSLGEKLVALSALRFRDFKPVIALEQGLTDPTCGEIMGLTGERLAREFGISRADQDAYALESHRKAVAAASRIAEEIAPLGVPPQMHDRLEADIGPRADQSIAALQKLRPYFDRRLGTVTVGNSCQITDGAVALILASEKGAELLGSEPLGEILGHAYRGCDPRRMGLGPVHASAPALAAAGVAFEDLARIELNEAFAAQVLACCAAFEDAEFARSVGFPDAVRVNRKLLNVNGGAIALGHPVGATGARLVLTLLHELRRSGEELGLATLCIGGGQGGAVVVKGKVAA
ncbi:MAG: acetyl-CoA C-acyltransferase [Planctomycetota bacterium]